MSLLIVGATGTLGRQIVRRALDEGFQVKCLVRNLRKAAFLKEWGASLVYGDLKIPDTIPSTLYAITAVIDASTARPYDPYSSTIVDLEGKLALIEASEKAAIKRFIFFSILDADKYYDIPLMNLKLSIENRLSQSSMNYTIFSLSGFFQGLISQYALPILDRQSIWVTGESTPVAYIDTLDVAKFTVKSLSIPAMERTKIPLVGCQTWNSLEIIELCEKLSGQKSKISQVPIQILQLAKDIMGFFQWGWNIAERLAFAEILVKGNNFSRPMEEVCNLLTVRIEDIVSLEEYLQEYFSRVMNKLKALNYQGDHDNQDLSF